MNLPYWTPFAGEGITEFYEYLKVLLFFVAPAIMIAFAIWVAGELIRAIINLFQEKRHKSDDEDEIYYF